MCVLFSEMDKNKQIIVEALTTEVCFYLHGSIQFIGKRPMQMRFSGAEKGKLPFIYVHKMLWMYTRPLSFDPNMRSSVVVVVVVL